MKSLWSFATHLDWAFNYLTHEKFELANVKSSVKAGSDDNLVGVMEYIQSQFDRSITWEDARLLIEKWGGPFAIKGVMSVEDAKRARDVGASAIMIRQSWWPPNGRVDRAFRYVGSYCRRRWR